MTRWGFALAGVALAGCAWKMQLDNGDAKPKSERPKSGATKPAATDDSEQWKSSDEFDRPSTEQRQETKEPKNNPGKLDDFPTEGWEEDWISTLSDADCIGIAERSRERCESKDCIAIAEGDKYECETADCRALLDGNKNRCVSNLCRAWITGKHRKYCGKSGDCKAIALKQKRYCESEQCKAIVLEDRWRCPGG